MNQFINMFFLLICLLSFGFATGINAQENNNGQKPAGTESVAQAVNAENNGQSDAGSEGGNVQAEAAAQDASSEANVSSSETEGQEKAEKKVHPADKSYYEPSRNHNPMMSPRDYEKLRKEEQARLEAEREARLAAERAANPQLYEEYKPKVKKPDMLKILDKKLRLQAIIANEVIINGETYSRGKIIKKTDGARVKSIGENYIIIEYKGKTLKKILRD